MEWLPIVFRFLPTIMTLAEALFGEKSGKQKKDFVLKSIPEIAKGIEDVSTGGQQETWQHINKNIVPISKTIDIFADMLFPSNEGSGG